MKKVTIQTTSEIDWSKPQWVQSNTHPDLIVLTTGEDYDCSFGGTLLPCLITPNGFYSKTWQKSSFHLLTEDIQFTISNKD